MKLPITLGLIILFGTAMKAQTVMERNAGESKETRAALYNLELIAGSMENELKYIAPPIEPCLKAAQINYRSEKLTARREDRPVQVESSNYTMQEAWLIKAGYYKCTSTPEWRQVKKVLSGR
ncbi:MAG: hypothetical protein JW830_10925 [Bacteroidales bacterium]|nr:hypothetical protein [Bacteroidales bacterium]